MKKIFHQFEILVAFRFQRRLSLVQIRRHQPLNIKQKSKLELSTTLPFTEISLINEDLRRATAKRADAIFEALLSSIRCAIRLK